MSFNPYLYAVEGPRAGMSQAPSGPLQSGPGEKRISILTPLSSIIDLEIISGIIDPPVPGTIYERDYFVTHATAGSRLQRVHISASNAAEAGPYSLQFMGRQGQIITEVTPPRIYVKPPIEVDVIEDTFPDFDGDLFLRVKASSQPLLFYVTIEVLTGKVL